MSNMSMIIPFRKKGLGIQYLVRREYVVGWDQNPDLCGISAIVADTLLEIALVEALEKDLSIHTITDDFIRLGVCAIKRNSEHMCYLYALDLGKKPEVFEKEKESYMWVNDEVLLETLDPQLLAAYARLKYLVL